MISYGFLRCPFVFPHSSSAVRRRNPNHVSFFDLAPLSSTLRSSCSINGRGSASRGTCRKTRRGIKEENEERDKVNCEVDVVSWRERRIRARVEVAADVDTLWGVLTDYERLADFIPNLVYSGRIPCPHRDRVWLEQRGLQRALYWHIEARVVLDLQELTNLVNGRELLFSMVEGDFKKFEGKWSVNSGPRSLVSTLSYEVNVIPRFNFPAIFIERIIRSDLPVNLRAIACQSETKFEKKQKAFIAASSKEHCYESSFTSPTSLHDADMSKNLNGEPESVSDATPVSTSIKLNSNWGIYGKVCRLDRQCMVDEVHLRRYNGILGDGGTCRFVIASITVKAPICEVWKVLTSYEALPEIVPNLAISKILSRDNNKVRVLQEGCKGLLYMVLHARVTLELCEKLENEISFEQVEGDFDSFRGKWRLEQLGDQHTLLKYFVESRMHDDSLLSESIVEEVIYEDLPSNLCAIRDYTEKREALQDDNSNTTNIAIGEGVSSFSTLEGKLSERVLENEMKERNRVPGLQRDFSVLKAEILAFISKYGQEGFMPMRKQLRLHRRVDIEKAISRTGGFRKIADAMNLSLAYKHRKPKGYWDNLENLQEEIERFQDSWGMDPAYMPSRKSLERAGRYDIARALEKWGGVQEVSRLLSLKLRHPGRRTPGSGAEKQQDIRLPSNDSFHNPEKTSSCRPCISQDTHKWLMKLKDLDINWVE